MNTGPGRWMVWHQGPSKIRFGYVLHDRRIKLPRDQWPKAENPEGYPWERQSATWPWRRWGGRQIIRMAGIEQIDAGLDITQGKLVDWVEVWTIQTKGGSHDRLFVDGAGERSCPQTDQGEGG